MESEDLNKLIVLRAELIREYERCRDYKNNKNAIMKEIDHARVVHETIKKLDSVLKNHVEFK